MLSHVQRTKDVVHIAPALAFNSQIDNAPHYQSSHSHNSSYLNNCSFLAKSQSAQVISKKKNKERILNHKNAKKKKIKSEPAPKDKQINNKFKKA